MAPVVRLLAALALLSLPALAAQRQQTFRVGAVVVHSAQVRSEISAGTSRLKLAGAPAISVQLDSAPPRLVRAQEVVLPDGVTRVTIHY
jgi:hypothetical protein